MYYFIYFNFMSTIYISIKLIIYLIILFFIELKSYCITHKTYLYTCLHYKDAILSERGDCDGILAT